MPFATTVTPPCIPSFPLGGNGRVIKAMTCLRLISSPGSRLSCSFFPVGPPEAVDRKEVPQGDADPSWRGPQEPAECAGSHVWCPGALGGGTCS